MKWYAKEKVGSKRITSQKKVQNFKEYRNITIMTIE